MDSRGGGNFVARNFVVRNFVELANPEISLSGFKTYFIMTLTKHRFLAARIAAKLEIGVPLASNRVILCVV